MSHSIVIVGVGPRGVYALDYLTRVLATWPLDQRVDVHLVEPNELGAGQVYRTTQPEYLLMNTVASQLTAFADAQIAPEDPFDLGPSMHGWMRDRGIDFDPNEYPSRAAHGRYLSWALTQILGRALANVSVYAWRCRAIDLRQVDGRHEVVLDEGFAPILADIVLLNTGHSTHHNPMHDELSAFASEMTATGRGAVAFHPSIYPVEQHILPVKPTQTLGILGLGLTAIDGIIAATEGNGGRFERGADAHLTYIPSGREPQIVSWCLPGVPPSARGVNQKGITFRHHARFLTRARVHAMREAERARGGSGQLDFMRQVFPLVHCEMEYIYYTTLRGADFGERYLRVAELPEERAQLLSEVEPALRFCWDHLQDPLAGRTPASKEEYTSLLRDLVQKDLAEAARGNMQGPYKAATDVLRDLRGNIRYVVEYGGLTADSQCWFDRVLWPLHNRICAGPPAIRLEQLLALVEAGVLDISAGPNPRLTADSEGGCFRLTPTAYPGEGREIHVLIDGRIAMPTVTTDKSPLLTRLLARGLIRPFANTTDGFRYTPCGIDITPENRVVASDGTVSDTLYAMGILAEGTQLYTFVAAAPGVAARPLVEARGWALQVHERLRAAEEATTPQLELRPVQPARPGAPFPL